jgi:hypothetical protein
MASRRQPVRPRRPKRWGGAGAWPTPRDAAALAWITEQFTVRTDTLALLLGKLSPETPRTVHRWQYAPGQWTDVPALGAPTVRHHLRRWLGARWVRVEPALGRCWVVPTSHGMGLAGRSFRAWSVVPSQLDHLHAVALVRLAVEAANPQAEWVSERALARLRAQQRASWWLPDGALPTGDDPASGHRPLHLVEVELTPKHLARLGQVFEDRYPSEVQTTYFAPPAHVDGLRRRLAVLEQATRARNEPWSRVNVVPLPELPGLSYGGAT